MGPVAYWHSYYLALFLSMPSLFCRYKLRWRARLFLGLFCLLLSAPTSAYCKGSVMGLLFIGIAVL